MNSSKLTGFLPQKPCEFPAFGIESAMCTALDEVLAGKMAKDVLWFSVSAGTRNLVLMINANR